MTKGYKNRIKKRIEQFTEANYKRISKEQMKMGNGLFNNRCQMNAVQQVKEGKMDKVYSCIIFNDKEYPIVHFINQDSEGYFIDNTLGHQYEIYNYYIINEINKEQYSEMNHMLNTIKKSLLNTSSNKILNKLYGVNIDNLGI